jgi:hypothetical protein
MATQFQSRLGRLFDVQVFPESDDVKIPPSPAAATNLLPSADTAKEVQPRMGALFDVQVFPEFVEVQMP